MAAITDGLELPGQTRKQTSFDITNYPPAQKGLAQPAGVAVQPIPGDAARAARMQAQYDQPVTRGALAIGQISGFNAPAAQALPQPAAASVSEVPAIGRDMAGVGAQDGNGWSRTAIVGVAGRMQADGVPSFTNNAQAFAGAGPQKAIGKVDGSHGISYGAPGDAARAIQSFDRANEIRRDMIRDSRRGQIGEGGGRLTIVRDSSRAPSLTDMLIDRQDARRANTEATREGTRQNVLSGMDERLTGQLQRQLLGHEVQAAEQSNKRQSALGGILAGLDDPRLQGDARTRAERSYLLQAAPSAFASLSSKGANQLSSPMQRLEDDDLSAIGSAGTMNSELARIDNQIATGQLNLGLVANAKSEALNAIGRGDQNARNYASLNSTLEKLRNESLRLNTGVQTEGDAQRAWNELLTNLKSPDLVRQRLAEISALNERAIGIRTGIINNRRSSQGVEALDVASVLGREAPRSPQLSASAGRPVSIESDSDYEALPSGSLFIAPDGSTRRKP